MSEMSPSPKAVILAAGRGNRLRPLTDEVPKCLLEVGEKSILSHQIQALRRAGVEEIQIVTGHGAARVREVCEGVATFAHNAAYDTTNSFDSLGCMNVEVGPAGLIVMNSDVIFHPDLFEKLLADEHDNVLLADFSSDLGEEEMKIVVDDGGRIVHISKAIDPREAHAENLGVLKLGQETARRLVDLSRSRDRDPVICWVPDGIHYLREEEAFYALPIGELPWIEIDYRHDLDRANEVVYPRLHEALWVERA